MLKQENEQLIKLCKEKGIDVPEDLIYKGPGIKNATERENQFQFDRESKFESP